MLWALNDAPTENPTQAFVLVALADNAWDDGRGAFPAVSTIAKRVRASERTVQYNLRALEALGLIRRGDQALAASLGRHAPTVYELALEMTRSRAVSAFPQVSRGAESAPLKLEVVPKSLRGATRGATDDVLGVTPIAPEPIPKPGKPVGAVGGVTHHAREAAKPPTIIDRSQPPEFSTVEPSGTRTIQRGELASYDTYGRTTPRCDRHLTSTTDDPCRACGDARVEFQAAQKARHEDLARARAVEARRQWAQEAGDAPKPVDFWDRASAS